MIFNSARLKVDWAEKHIRKLYDFVQAFPAADDFHSVAIEEDSWGFRDPEIAIAFSKSQDEFLNPTALIMGDICHSLRSALDYMWYEIVSISGKQTKWTRFPVGDTRQELVRTIDTALEEGKISEPVHRLVLGTIKPYQEGDVRIWMLHQMNIIDKHQLLIPTFPMMGIEGIRIQNNENIILEVPVIFTDASFRRRLKDFGSFGSHPKLHDKGHVAIGQGFHLGTPCVGQPVIPTLQAIAKAVLSTIEAFELLF
jgi:hypothetical protein